MGWLDRVGRFIDDVLLLPDDVRVALESASDAMEAEAYEEAEALFREVLSARPTLVRAAAGLAEARESLGDEEGAREALAEARELAPEDGELALWDARLALAAGEVDRAADAARHAAIRLAPLGGAAFVRACRLRALAEWERGRADRASRELSKALTITPDDVELRLLLIEALVDARRLAAARMAAAACDPEALGAEAAARIGRALHRAGAEESARPWLLRAADEGDAEALHRLARMELASGRLEAAEARCRESISRGGGAPSLGLLAQVLAASGRGREAADAFAAASDLNEDVDLSRAAARTVPLDDRRLLLQRADALERLAPGDPAALANRLWAALEVGDLETARVIEVSDEPRALLGRARLILEEGRAAPAIEALDAYAGSLGGKVWSAVDAEAASGLRRRAYEALWRSSEGEVDLPAAIDAVARFADAHDLGEAARNARTLRDELDRPLLLAVLGEFNAGKSTLINAFIGAEVAPMGIVPTTATLNILRGGAERRVRVVRKDGTTREGGYEHLDSLLDEAEAAEGEVAVDHVEIVLPSETLERVWILDTPGTNALDPAHEALAKEAARRADVVLWVFDAGQAGKQTESRMHAAMRESGRLVVPVLNKQDRLAPGDLSKVLGVLERGFVGAERAVPVSARAALAARVSGDVEAEEASGYAALLRHLEERVFSRSRTLKRRACAGRLLAILDAALATEAEVAAPHRARLEASEGALARLGAAASPLLDAVDGAIRALESAQDRAYREAAEEVLSFVRPRTHRFSEHGADREDREFLREVLERRLAAAVESCEVDLRARILEIVEAERVERETGLSVDRLELEVTKPVASFWGYQRGLMAGDALRRFFEEVLPHAALEVQPLAAGLVRTRADARAELRPALADGVGEILTAIERARREEIAAERDRLDDLLTRVYGPLRALRVLLGEVL